MKRLLVLVPLFMLLGFGAAQAQGGQGGQGGPERFREQQKVRLKDSLGLTDAQIETVLKVQQEFQPKMREIRMDQSASETDKAAKIKALNEERKKKWAAELKDEALATKIDDYYSRMPMRPGGNRPPGGNN